MNTQVFSEIDGKDVTLVARQAKNNKTHMHKYMWTDK